MVPKISPGTLLVREVSRALSLHLIGILLFPQGLDDV